MLGLRRSKTGACPVWWGHVRSLSKHARQCHAFILVELLVVIAGTDQQMNPARRSAGVQQPEYHPLDVDTADALFHLTIPKP